MSRYGPIGNDYTDASLYEIAAHPGLQKHRGAIVLVFPDKPELNSTDVEQHSSRFAQLNPTHGDEFWRTQDRPPIPGLDKTQYDLLEQAIPQALQLDSEDENTGTLRPSGASTPTHPETKYCFAEVIDVCNDGDIIVRFGFSPGADEVKIRPDRVMIIASGDTIDSEEGSEWTDDETVSNSSEATIGDVTDSDDNEPTNESAGAADMEIDCEEVVALDPEGDGPYMWLTDVEKDLRRKRSQADHGPDEEPSKSNDAISADGIPPNASDPITLDSNSALKSGHMPPFFSVLDSPVPQDHHFLTKSSNTTTEQLRRISKEHKILASSLPDSAFVRCWETRLDILRILIIGPADTPYEYAPFMIDMYFSPSFPDAPPEAFFHSKGGRINPNLYEDGKICLSLLGTWRSDMSTEAWSPRNSSVLQIIVSLLGLVLVKEPYYSKRLQPLYYASYAIYDDLCAFGSSTTKRRHNAALPSMMYNLSYLTIFCLKRHKKIFASSGL